MPLKTKKKKRLSNWDKQAAEISNKSSIERYCFVLTITVTTTKININGKKKIDACGFIWAVPSAVIQFGASYFVHISPPQQHWSHLPRGTTTPSASPPPQIVYKYVAWGDAASRIHPEGLATEAAGVRRRRTLERRRRRGRLFSNKQEFSLWHDLNRERTWFAKHACTTHAAACVLWKVPARALTGN